MSQVRYSKGFAFEKARPAWIKGDENEMNVTAVLAAEVTGKTAQIRLAGASSFILTVNGASTCHGFASHVIV